MELIELNAKKRETKGKGAARKLRVTKAIPAIVYGAKIDPMMLSLDAVEFVKVIRDYGNTGLFFNLKIEDGPDKTVMLKAMQMDAFSLEYLHVDLHEVDMDHSVTVMVPVETSGVCPGVKNGGGMIQIIRRELEVICKPVDMPESIVLDISGLDIGDSIHVKDIDLGDSIVIPHEVNFTIITIVPPTADDSEDSEEDEEDLIEEDDTSEE
ncbi:MAG: 50S ribosomal protein L25 [Proteobacteria bacterium]|nr:50S ribosomal protein L25 [Desulfobacula sp.]MBU3953265.1 50S ribosomal protein L25 [Pseudomonadota bacterium]MBU4129750.1 50S ribosomal protein L25 [Pseudomonadota bacterium]